MSDPVGPLTGRLAQPDNIIAAAETTIAPPSRPLRRGTQIVNIN
jgi:hypothetical protein